ncbi:5'(3')-deoxyribonucleotidase [Flavobacterium sp. Sd200]|uniref:5' nucleotidase, NT5C type n=1 Tax=Flavobacterium sp. Sd200 TaxID=2692211 RepID=UPI001368B58D|nr:5'(3')-deoxyribonucleotidase [Flavobacterium sp. Sd200]MXN92865.1 5'(3')-deoxyribonucleotidase [Flavobacterium sp. Sd200]
METGRKTIAIDMDGVIADVEKHYIDWYERDYGVVLDRKSMEGFMEHDATPVKGAIGKFLVTPGFFRTVPVMEGAVEAVKDLMKDYDVYIVSAAMEFPLSLYEKHQWLAEHFPFISWKNIIFCGDKSVIDTDFLIDDHCKNLDFCKGKPLMFTAFHNVNHTHHQRVNNWKEVPALVRDLTQLRKKVHNVAIPAVPENRARW